MSFIDLEFTKAFDAVLFWDDSVIKASEEYKGLTL
jgi:hypothetical protein